jgi:hypothetical protein
MWPKICLANCYGFVIMRGTYEQNIPFSGGGRFHPADRLRMFDILCR